MAFVHLHVHTQYSILDGFSSIATLFDRAEAMGMPALAITDHGNMYGIKEFFKFADKHRDKETKEYKVKPIIGCEVYVTRHYDPKLKDNEHRAYYHLILLAKNYQGYKNLSNIVSLGFIEGLYYGKPRVSHEIIEKYHEGLICCSACLAGEIPKDIVSGNMEAARKAVEWHKKVFGDDYYLEVMLHKTEVPGLSLEVYEQQKISNEGIFKLAKETGVKVVATNDVHFVDKEDGPAHDLGTHPGDALAVDAAQVNFQRHMPGNDVHRSGAALAHTNGGHGAVLCLGLARRLHRQRTRQSRWPLCQTLLMK